MNSARLSLALGGAPLHVLQRCGHSPQEEQPEKFAALVAAFVEALPPRAAAKAA